MPTTLTLEDFESYPGSGDFEVTPSRYGGTTGDGWSISVSGPSGVRPFVREYDAPTHVVVDKPPGVGGNKHLLFGPFQSSQALSATHDLSDGLGVWLYSYRPATYESPSSPLSIQWAAESGIGGITVTQLGMNVSVHEWYDGGTYAESTSVHAAPVTVPDPSGSPFGWLWLDISFHRADGWVLRDPFTGVVASGDYPWTIPAGALWSMSYLPTNSDRSAFDNFYAWRGADTPAVRLYPRDDGRGMSAAPRHWPMPKSARIIGRIP